MRRVSMKAPDGQGERIAKIAISCGARQVSVSQAKSYKEDGRAQLEDMIEFDSSTPVARKFVDTLTSMPFYDPDKISISLRQPRSIIHGQIPAGVTVPIIMPTIDIYEELWQFSHITFSFVIRVVIASLLLSYGMIHDHLLLIVAGLLFLPMQPAIIALSFGLCTREWRLAFQGLCATSAAVLCVVAAGAFVAFLAGPPLQFQSFSTPTVSFLISILIGVAAALSSADDAGHREMIGLAVTAQVAVLPAWFGISLVLGFPEYDVTWERIWIFLMITATITAAAAITYALIGIRRAGIERYVSCTHGDCPDESPALRRRPGRAAMP